jgi:hypothetical protein
LKFNMQLRLIEEKGEIEGEDALNVEKLTWFFYFM